MNKEEWRPVKDFEELYEVSNFGKVKSLHYKNRVKILKPDIDVKSNTSYERVTLSNNRKTKRFSVHRLVAEAFIPNIYNKPFVNHIDNNGLNNNASNLEWVTASENMMHAQRQGRLFDAQSKGGKKGGGVRRQRKEERLKKILNTRINDWIVVDFKKDAYQKKGDLIVKCVICSKNFVKRSDDIISGRIKRCKTCNYKIRKKHKKD